jgi:hypothetical protein
MLHVPSRYSPTTSEALSLIRCLLNSFRISTDLSLVAYLNGKEYQACVHSALISRSSFFSARLFHTYDMSIRTA